MENNCSILKNAPDIIRNYDKIFFWTDQHGWKYYVDNVWSVDIWDTLVTLWHKRPSELENPILLTSSNLSFVSILDNNHHLSAMTFLLWVIDRWWIKDLKTSEDDIRIHNTFNQIKKFVQKERNHLTIHEFVLELEREQNHSKGEGIAMDQPFKQPLGGVWISVTPCDELMTTLYVYFGTGGVIGVSRNSHSDQDCTRLHTHGKDYFVKESPEQIMKMIKHLSQ